MILAIVPKIALGAFVGGVIGSLVTQDWIYTLVWAFAIPVFIFAALARNTRRKGFPAGEGLALARIETVQRTGVETAGVQLCDARLTVVPSDDVAYQTTARLPIATDDLRRFSPGTVIVVRRLRAQGPDVVLVPDAPDEWVGMAERAQADGSALPAASEVPAWETATTTSPATRKPGGRPQRGRSSAVGTAVSLTIIAVVAALVLIPAYPSIGRAAASIGTGRWDGTNLLTGVYQQDAVDAIFAAAGHTQFENIYFYDSYVFADGLTSPGATTLDSYQYRYGRAWREGPAFSQPDVLENVIFDASTIDFGNVGVAVRDARERANLVGTVSILAYVARPYVSGDDAEPQPPLIYVSLSGDYDNASYQYTLDGKIIG